MSIEVNLSDEEKLWLRKTVAEMGFKDDEFGDRLFTAMCQCVMDQKAYRFGVIDEFVNFADHSPK